MSCACGLVDGVECQVSRGVPCGRAGLNCVVWVFLLHRGMRCVTGDRGGSSQICCATEEGKCVSLLSFCSPTTAMMPLDPQRKVGRDEDEDQETGMRIDAACGGGESFLLTNFCLFSLSMHTDSSWIHCALEWMLSPRPCATEDR